MTDVNEEVHDLFYGGEGRGSTNLAIVAMELPMFRESEQYMLRNSK